MLTTPEIEPTPEELAEIRAKPHGLVAAESVVDPIAGEGKFLHRVVTGEFAADGAGAAGEHVEDAGRNAGALGQLANGQCRQRGL